MLAVCSKRKPLRDKCYCQLFLRHFISPIGLGSTWLDDETELKEKLGSRLIWVSFFSFSISDLISMIKQTTLSANTLFFSKEDLRLVLWLFNYSWMEIIQPDWLLNSFTPRSALVTLDLNLLIFHNQKWPDGLFLCASVAYKCFATQSLSRQIQSHTHGLLTLLSLTVWCIMQTQNGKS